MTEPIKIHCECLPSDTLSVQEAARAQGPSWLLSAYRGDDHRFYMRIGEAGRDRLVRALGGHAPGDVADLIALSRARGDARAALERRVRTLESENAQLRGQVRRLADERDALQSETSSLRAERDMAREALDKERRASSEIAAKLREARGGSLEALAANVGAIRSDVVRLAKCVGAPMPWQPDSVKPPAGSLADRVATLEARADAHTRRLESLEL